VLTPYFDRGGITLYCGDCLDVLPQLSLPGDTAVVTDPPYGMNESARRVASRKNMAPTTDYGEFCWDSEPASAEEIKAVLSVGKQHIIWGGNFFELIPSRGWLVWDKLNSGDFADAELAWTDLPTSVRVFRHMWNGMIRQSERDCPRVHPTQKPIALMRWCFSFLGNGSTILDPFAGSGTTLVACVQTGRRGIGIELDERYCEIAVRRIEQALAQPRLFPIEEAGPVQLSLEDAP
jgi:DNA modification methylase